jgi:hypothetical protein
VEIIPISFFALMSWMAKFSVAVCTFPMLAGTESIEAATQGFTEGRFENRFAQVG